MAMKVMSNRISSYPLDDKDIPEILSVVVKRLNTSKGNYNLVELIWCFWYNYKGKVDCFGSALLDYAATEGEVVLVELILSQRQLCTDLHFNWSLVKACEAGHAAVVKVLIADPHVDPAKDDNYIIRRAARNGHAEVVKLLLEDGRVDPAARHNEAIRTAANNGHAEVVKILLNDKRVDPAACEHQALKNAARKRHIEVIKALISDKRVEFSAAEHEFALSFSYVEMARLREGGLGQTSPPAQSEAVRSPNEINKEFLAACRHGESDSVKRGISIVSNETVTNGFIAACLKENVEIIKILMSHIDVEVRNEELRDAAARGCVPIVAALSTGQCIEYCDEALRAAAERGHTPVVRLLLPACVGIGGRAAEIVRAAWTNGHVETVLSLLEDIRVRSAVKGKNVFLFTPEMHMFPLDLRLEMNDVAIKYS